MGLDGHWEARGAAAGDVWFVVFSQTEAVVEKSTSRSSST